jgi:hypothetical protein
MQIRKNRNENLSKIGCRAYFFLQRCNSNNPVDIFRRRITRCWGFKYDIDSITGAPHGQDSIPLCHWCRVSLLAPTEDQVLSDYTVVYGSAAGPRIWSGRLVCG